jgi:pimeloyl-ACP methyl ester carboxylesterase
MNAPVQRSRRWLRWLWLGPAVLVAVLLVVAVAGFTYEKIEAARDAKRFPPPGVLVDVGDFRMHLYCIGSGSPTVVLDAGLGVLSLTWAPVQKRVAKTTRVCSYDRAGYAWSDSAPTPRTSQNIAANLRALLANAGEKGPFVLVGHSFGGYNIRVFAHEYPDEVVGLVLVDSSHEDQSSRLPAAVLASSPGASLFAVLEVAAHLGVGRLFPSLTNADERSTASLRAEAPEVLGPMSAFGFSPRSAATVADEMKRFEESAAQVRNARVFGGLPLIVLSAGQVEPIPGVSQADLDAFQRVWLTELQPDLAMLSTRGRQLVVKDSSHMIPLLRPDIVADAIGELVRSVRVPKQGE